MDHDDELVTGGAMRGSIAAEALHEYGLWTRLGPGDRVGPFRIDREIGRGGSSLVFDAHRDNGTFEQRVALKLLRDSRSAQRLALSECGYLAKLNHPNIARVIDTGLIEGIGAWLAIDYIEGVPLDHWCQVNQCSWQARCRLIVLVAKAVHHAHRQLLAHGDIKPANILVDAEGNPRLLDFGIAQWLGSDRGSAACTPAYASPEQQRGMPISAVSDVFQLGKLAQTLLGSNLTRKGRMPPLVGAELQQLLARATQIDPEQRFASAHEFAAEIDDLMSLRPPRTLPLTSVRRLRWLWLRQRRVLIWLGVLTLLVVMLASRLQEQKQTAYALAQREQSANYELARLNASLLAEAIKSVDGDQEAFRNFVRARQKQVLDEQRIDPLVKYQVLRGLASAHMDIGEFEDAKFAIETALALRVKLGLPADSGVAHLYCMKALGAALSGQIDTAQAAVQNSIGVLDAAEVSPDQALQTQLCLGSALTQLGDMRAARQRLDWSVRVAEYYYGKNSREYLDALSGSAELSRIWMDFGRALRENEFVFGRMSAVYGENARRTLDQYIRLQGARAAAGQAQVAEQNLAKLITQLRKEPRTGTYHLHSAHYYRGEALQVLGRYVEAATSYTTAIALLAPTSVLAPNTHQLSDKAMVSRMQLLLGHPQVAVDAHRVLLKFAERAHSDPISQALLKVHLADALLDKGGAAAEVPALLKSALPVLQTHFDADSFNMLHAQLQFVRSELADGALDKAAAIADSAKVQALQLNFPQHVYLAMRWQLVRSSIALQRSLPELAINAAERAIALGEQHLGKNHPLIARQRVLAVKLLETVDPPWAAAQIQLAGPILRASHPATSTVLRYADTWRPPATGVAQ